MEYIKVVLDSQGVQSRYEPMAYKQRIGVAMDPCLQLADYCAWEIQRKRESNDAPQSRVDCEHDPIEFEPFRAGPVEYY